MPGYFLKNPKGVFGEQRRTLQLPPSCLPDVPSQGGPLQLPTIQIESCLRNRVMSQDFPKQEGFIANGRRFISRISADKTRSDRTIQTDLGKLANTKKKLRSPEGRLPKTAHYHTGFSTGNTFQVVLWSHVRVKSFASCRSRQVLVFDYFIMELLLRSRQK